jgi:hypothetical protein
MNQNESRGKGALFGLKTEEDTAFETFYSGYAGYHNLQHQNMKHFDFYSRKERLMNIEEASIRRISVYPSHCYSSQFHSVKLQAMFLVTAARVPAVAGWTQQASRAGGGGGLGTQLAFGSQFVMTSRQESLAFLCRDVTSVL